MINYLFSPKGRISRARMWLYVLISAVVTIVTLLIFQVLWSIFPGSVAEDGTFHVEGAGALPYIVVGLAALVFLAWSAICVGIKRLHDRDKSGWWFLIQLVPLIGPIWYIVDTLFLKGTTGDNRFGPDPLAPSSGA